MLLLQTPKEWDQYELIDSGNGEKLERFGSQIIARPEPQALWEKNLPETEWKKLAHSYFIRKKGNHTSDNEWGEWQIGPNAREQWTIAYRHAGMVLKFRLGLTSFKHVGIFPEQAANWTYIYNRIRETDNPNPKVLNLFAYTGGASLAAKAAGADVTHVDSVKQVVGWARENMEKSRLSDIRWIVDDAQKFTTREVRRGKKYHGIILDPPAYGRGPDGEKWTLSNNLLPLLTECKKLLAGKGSFVILNLYSMGFSALIAENMLQSVFHPATTECGELYVTDRAARKLPLGVFSRCII